MAGLVNAACIYPEMLQVVLRCLFDTKAYLIVASFSGSGAAYNVLICNFFAIRSPSV
jgi:hypothetical protein